MKNKIPCEMVKDLLPLYVEELTQEKTNEEIRNHLEECPTCEKMLQDMKISITKVETASEGVKTLEINYLKKIKSNNRKKIIMGIGVTLFVGILFGILKLYVWGYPVSTYDTDLKLEGKAISINGYFYNSSSVYSHYKIDEKDGERYLVVYACLPSFWNHKDSFEIKYIMNDSDDFIINGDKVSSDGKIIEKMAQELYVAQNMYLGDMSSNSKIASILGIASKLGNYTNELQTTEEPYGWNFKFLDKISKNNEIKFNASMDSYSYILLALIKNCGEISWSYSIDGQQYTKKITEADTSEALSKDIKEYAKSAEQVQQLLDLMGIN
ncbi:MAG: DUF4825 domain-containing protein [Mobilitalea sp.]